MSIKSLRDHSRALIDFAAASEERARSEPQNWLLGIAAKNQRANADEALRAADIAEAQAIGELLEWRLSGRRLSHGDLPLDFLAKFAAPLNNLLVRSAFFARNKVDAIYGSADDLSRELGLSLVGVASGSTRLLIRGNTLPDTTGSAAFVDGVQSLFAVLSSSSDFTQFYEHLDDIGERAAEALHETLKAVESEECSLEVRWHSPGHELLFSATYDRVVQMRSLLEGLGEVQERREHLYGRVTLLAANGRIQLQLDDGRKATVRYRPRAQAALVAHLTLNAVVELDVVAKVTNDPISGDEIKRYSLTSLEAPLLTNQPVPPR